MTRKVFLVLLALVLALSMGLVACPEPPEPTTVEWDSDTHGNVGFSQLQWMASPEEALYPYSNVGAVEFAFAEGAGDWLLDEYGGGWINVVIDTGDYGGYEQWAVQNLYLTYKTGDYLSGSTATVQFSLGLDNQTAIDELGAAVFLSREPLEEQPQADELVPYPVSSMPYLVGGLDGPGSVTWDTPLTVAAFVGTLAMPANSASICIPESQVAKINECVNGCAPGSAARSIHYLGVHHKFTTDSAQDIYTDLKEYMNTTVNGTATKDFTPGKDSYCEAKGFNIATELVLEPGLNLTYARTADSWDALLGEVVVALRDKCDVEIRLGKYEKQPDGRIKRVQGHAAMVTHVTIHEDGSASIRRVDDPTQGDGKAENEFTPMVAKNNTFITGGMSPGWAVDGFWIQCLQGVVAG